MVLRKSVYPKELLFFSSFQRNFFAHPQDLTDAEITEYACSLSKYAMGSMTVGTTQMKIPVVVNPFNTK